MSYLLVALGAAVGAPLRYLTDRVIRARTGSDFPWGTFAVNVAGSALLGFLAALPADGALMALFGAGFCGALTTYSTFGYETVRLVTEGWRARAALNAGGSVAAGLTAAYAGALLATWPG
ncbi:fluoride efflux transporter CrcB [Spongiactinospora gelatinilytica]|uniref:Fluoride-specific ion channel FluC n=1 Tax=Spongiactinospora gelatinilytica TaxID=2666298 RepID=A0A2W2GFG0_9ACTN|nr:fluoride efflux transporter CrcB [Spongiactinospora gelatinilytica]PZG46562.1 fluoride efflux transporter CrcB [Spongiactinospora gelatinilytica]